MYALQGKGTVCNLLLFVSFQMPDVLEIYLYLFYKQNALFGKWTFVFAKHKPLNLKGLVQHVLLRKPRYLTGHDVHHAHCNHLNNLQRMITTGKIDSLFVKIPLGSTESNEK